MRKSVQDILEVGSGVIVHAVSDSGVLEGGLTKQLAKKFPQVVEPYVLCCNDLGKNPVDLLGRVLMVSVGDVTVANLFCVHGHGDKRRFEYMAFRVGLEKIASDQPEGDIFLPYKMGAGMLGGDWKIIERLAHEITGGRACVCVLGKETQKT